MKISVITVCLNAEKTIIRTFDSILSQTYEKFEYIIIDGGSSDKTVEYIEKYAEVFERRSVAFHYISASDKGLYDAMNKGAGMASGKYLIYMNADDEFADAHCLNIAAGYLDGEIDVLYGDTIVINARTKKKQMSKSVDTIRKHLPFIPQSAFIKTVTQRKYPFDLGYKISADYDSFLRMYMEGCIFRQVRYVFSRFHTGGISNRDEWKTYKEDIVIKHKYGILNIKSPLQFIKYLRKYIYVKTMK